MRRIIIPLRGKKKIEALFQKGFSFFLYPFKVYYLEQKYTNINEMIIVIPKRYIKKAVHRNLIRRRIKEALYLQKNTFLNIKYLSNSTNSPLNTVNFEKKSPQKCDEEKIEINNHENAENDSKNLKNVVQNKFQIAIIYLNKKVMTFQEILVVVEQSTNKILKDK